MHAQSEGQAKNMNQNATISKDKGNGGVSSCAVKKVLKVLCEEDWERARIAYVDICKQLQASSINCVSRVYDNGVGVMLHVF